MIVICSLERRISRFLMTLACLAVLSGGEGFARAIEDLAGREVSLPERVHRLIALGPGALRLVVYLGATDRIVGIEDLERRMARDCYFRPYAHALDDAFFKLPVVGTGGPGKCPDFESVMLCSPDVIVTVSFDQAQLENMQDKTGVPVIYLSYGELGVWTEEAMTSLALLGEILGCQERATRLNLEIEAMQKDLERRALSVSEEKKPSVYFGGISFKGSHGITSTEAGYAPARMVNALNLADTLEKEGHLMVDKEQLLVWNPDVLFFDVSSKAIMDQDFDENREFYGLLKATQSNRTFSLLPFNYYNTNIEIALINAYFIGKCLYPDAFRDVDMVIKAREVLNTFLDLHPDEDLPAFHPIRFPEQGPLQWE